MKNISFILAFLLAVPIVWLACKKHTQEKLSPDNDKALAIRSACTYETLSGDITSNRTLSAATVYRIDGCVTVKSGATLDIPAGTLLQGMKTPTNGGKSFLIVERGAMLNISGTSTNPVVFTSDQSPGNRAAGDWGGLRVFGEANNNNSNAISVDLGCAVYTGGGTNNSDNSGVMEYFQVHFAGAPANTNDLSRAAIMLNSVGSGTMIANVQVAHTKNDALLLAGGNVKIEKMISYNADRTDFKISYGNTSEIQFITSLRLDNGAVPSQTAYGLDITNQPNTSSTSMPLTTPVISNASIVGPNFCNPAAVSSNFSYAVRFSNNGAGKIYNSVFSSWRTLSAQSGLEIVGGSSPSSVTQTVSGNLEFSYNSFHNSGTTPFSSPSWTGGCGSSMAAWITGAPTAPACKEAGNQFSVTTLGYDASFCDNFCSAMFSSDFTLGTTSLSAPNFGWDTGNRFSHPTYRGAFGAADWTQGWTDWCPQDKVYCE